jgi:signal transduction histidine kinase
MLKRLRIGGRVNMLIALPMLALVALAAASLWTMRRSGFESAEYQRLETLDNLRADAAPAYASLSPIWTEVNLVASLSLSPTSMSTQTQVEIDHRIDGINALRGLRTRSLAYWSEQGFPLEVSNMMMDDGGEAGMGFFELFDREFLPAVRWQSPTAIVAALERMSDAYDRQETALQDVVEFAAAEQVAQESRVNDFVRTAEYVLYFALVALVALSMLLAVFVRRSIVGPIKSLAGQARQVATSDLPTAVHQIAAGQSMPVVSQFETERRGELADLGRSLTAMQESALELAAEQARAKRTVSENLINIARRNQSLLGRTLGFISELEQSERDPGTLDNLFRLDHLATRMRRNAQSLLVLADAEPVRRFAPPTPVGDVLRAALSEVENYAQVELGDVGPGFVQGSLVPEIAHLMAELIENATSFSPPQSRVTVVGRSVPEGHQIVVIDHGIGMSADELKVANDRLSTVSTFEQESNRMLGFHVVSRLAARHGIRVMLTATPGGQGTTAIVRLPRSAMDTTVAGTGLTGQTPIVGPAPITVAPAPSTADIAPQAPVPAPVVEHREPVHAPAAALSLPLTTAFAPERPPVSAEEIRSIVEGQRPAVVTVAPAAPIAEHHAVVDPGLALAAAAPAADTPAASASDLLGALRLPLLPALDTSVPPGVTSTGLPRRVRGAQLPELGDTSHLGPVARSADEVRAALGNLQRGVDLGRLSQPSNHPEGEV